MEAANENLGMSGVTFCLYLVMFDLRDFCVHSMWAFDSVWCIANGLLAAISIGNTGEVIDTYLSHCNRHDNSTVFLQVVYTIGV